MITLCNAYKYNLDFLLFLLHSVFSLYFCETKHITMTMTRTKTTTMMMTRVQMVYIGRVSVHCSVFYRVLCLLRNMEMKNCENKTKQKHELGNREQEYEQIIISNGGKKHNTIFGYLQTLTIYYIISNPNLIVRCQTEELCVSGSEMNRTEPNRVKQNKRTTLIRSHQVNIK